VHSLGAAQGDAAVIFFYSVNLALPRRFALFAEIGCQFVPHRARAGNQPPENGGGEKTGKEGKRVYKKSGHRAL